MSEIRYDLLHNEYIIIAPERLHRPIPTNQTKLHISSSVCPFCPGHEHYAPNEIFSIKVDGTWRTRVVPNLYKAVQIETPYESRRDGINERWGGYGAHEIIIDTPKHNADFDTLEHQEIVWWIETIIARISDLKQDRKLISLNIFKNRGLTAGATQSHPHTQIIGLPLMTKRQLATFEHALAYYYDHGRSLHEDIFTFESDKERSLKVTHNFLSYLPFASAFPFETIILSKNHSCISAIGQEEKKELSIHIRNAFYALKKELGDFDYNLLLYITPINENFENYTFFDQKEQIFRFFFRITPRIYKIAGYELLSGSMINPVQPELACKLLRRWYETSS